MHPDWKRLAPDRPVEPGSPEYVDRPANGPALARWVLAGRSTVLVAGPVGVGKSSELGRAANELQQERVACLVRLDRFENMHEITAGAALVRIIGRLAWFASKVLGLPISPELLQLQDENASWQKLLRAMGMTPETLALSTLREVAGHSRQGRVTLLIDGLEKIPVTARAVLDALAAFLPADVDLVVVVPYWAVYGPGADDVLRPGAKLSMLRPLHVPAGRPGAEGRRFFRDLLEQRLELPVDVMARVLDQAAELSGGVPRTFLQLIEEAAYAAEIHRGDVWPNRDDLQEAIADQRDHLRRLLLPGDREAIQAVSGTDGAEMELERKVRLLTHGMLLETDENGCLQPHPLLEQVPGEEQARA